MPQICIVFKRNDQAPHFFFSLLEKKKRAAWRSKEKEGLGADPGRTVLLSRATQREATFHPDRYRTDTAQPLRPLTLVRGKGEMLRSCLQHHGATAKRERQCVRLVPDWERFYALLCWETTTRSIVSPMQGSFFILHPGALFFFRPLKKEEGAETVLPTKADAFAPAL